MGFGDSLDIGKKIGEERSANDLMKSKDEPDVKVRKVSHERADAIAESLEGEPIENVGFSKPRRGTPLTLGPMVLNKRGRIERICFIAVLLLFSYLILFRPGSLHSVDDQADAFVRRLVTDKTLNSLRQQFPLATPAELASRANQLLLPLLGKDEIRMVARDIVAFNKGLYKWEDGTPYLFKADSWNFVSQSVLSPETAYYLSGIIGLAIVLLVFFSTSVMTRSFPAAFLASFVFTMMPGVLDVIMAGSPGRPGFMVLAGAMILAGITGYFTSKHKWLWGGLLLLGFLFSITLYTWIHWLFAAIAGVILWYSARGPRWLPVASWTGCFAVFSGVFWYARVRSGIWPVKSYYLLAPSTVFGAMGGYIITFLAFLGLLLLLLRTSDYPKPFMLAGGAFASLIGSAFTSISTLPSAALIAALLIAILAEYVLRYAPSWFEFFNLESIKAYSKPVLTVMFALLVFVVLWPRASGITDQLPVVHDGMQTIAFSVHDAEKLFVWDGKDPAWTYLSGVDTIGSLSVDAKSAVWMARALTDTDINRAVSRLRILACSRIDRLMNSMNGSETQRFDALESVMGMNIREAKAWLASNGQPDVTGITHCKAPKSYIIVPDDMLSRINEFASLASWDPAQKEFNNATELSEALSIPFEDAQKRMTRFQRGLVVSDEVRCSRTKDTLQCDTLTINHTSLRVVQSPVKRVVLVEDSVRSADFPDAYGPLHFVIAKSGNSFYARAVDDEVTDMLITRLWLGQGSGYFVPTRVIKKPERIILYRIDWSGSSDAMTASTLELTEPTFLPNIEKVISNESRKFELEDALVQGVLD